ncbi:MAG: SCO family protein [Proteobacteria bacterium]|nr:SCO family protein [Pseudomonadota bacterium]
MNMPTRRILYGLLLGLLAVAAMAVALEISGKRQRSPVVTGEALVGGPFTLVDPRGASVSDTDFAGRYMLIYFGYTHCPDVCPLALQKMSMALDILTAEGIDLAPLQPIFITVDPARDSAAVMGDYIAAFHPSLIGLTGSSEAIAVVATAYLVSSARTDANGKADMDGMENMGDMGKMEDGGYLMAHSSVIYLMGPDGRYVSHFNAIATPGDIAARLRPLLD